MGTVTRAKPDAREVARDEVLVSADSHVMEPPDLWTTRVPEPLRAKAPSFPPHKVGEGFQAHAGGWDPTARQKEMATDGVSAEVLYPTLALKLVALGFSHVADFEGGLDEWVHAGHPLDRAPAMSTA